MHKSQQTKLEENILFLIIFWNSHLLRDACCRGNDVVTAYNGSSACINITGRGRIQDCSIVVVRRNRNGCQTVVSIQTA